MNVAAFVGSTVRTVMRHRLRQTPKLTACIVIGVLSVFSREACAQFDPNNPIPAVIPHGPLRVDLRPVVRELVSPITLLSPDDGTKRQFIVEQIGQVLVRKNGVLLATPFLDVSARLVTLNPRYDERGLLGMAFDPGFGDPTSPGHQRIFTYTSEPVAGTAEFPDPYATTLNHHSVLASWRVSAADPDVIDPSSRQEILRIDQPQSNHNGGTIAFGPDGLLYIGLGDGGGANDNNPNGHNPTIGNGQDTTIALGKMLRIDVNGTNSANGKYGIPPTNPFVAGGGLPEIYAFGFRNPFRFSFDGNDLLVADVGQNKIEELDRVEVGKNYGWRLKEGTFKFNTDGTISDDLTGLPPGLADPILQYDHDEGISICGGFVYRGDRIPELKGKYVFGDFSRSFSTPSGRLFYADLATAEIREFILGTEDAPLDFFVKGMGIDADGEIYVLASKVLGPSAAESGERRGVALKLVPPALQSTLLYQTGSPVPSAGLPGRGVPADAVFSTFGAPSINDLGEVAFAANYSSASGAGAVIVGPQLDERTVADVLASTDQLPPGPAGTPVLTDVVFASFKDPVLNSGGKIAFIAGLKSASADRANSGSGIWTNTGGTLRLLAREGDDAPGTSGSYRSFTSIALDDATATGSTLAFVAALDGGASAGVRSSNDLGLWMARGSDTPELVLREGQSLPIGGRAGTVKSFRALTALPGAAGQGHGVAAGSVVAQVKFTDRRQALLRFKGGGQVEVIAETGDSMADSTAKSFSSLTQTDRSDAAFIVKLDSTPTNDEAVFDDLNNTTRQRVAREGEAAPDTDANFSSFHAVVNGEGAAAAFLASLRGGSASRSTDTGIWWMHGETLSLVAREGTPAAGVAGGVWSKFQSLALPDGSAGPLFVATLRSKPATRKSSTGLWAVDSSGAPQLLLRTGGEVQVGAEAKGLRDFTALNAVSGSPAQTRSFNSAGQLIYRALFTDGTEAIQTIALP